MAGTNQMHQVTESAQVAQVAAGDVSGQMHLIANNLRTAVGEVIPAQWDMDQAVAFSRAHQTYQDGIAKLILELQLIGENTGLSIRDYGQVDAAHSATINRIEPGLDPNITRLV